MSAVLGLLCSIRDDAHICSRSFLKRHLGMLMAVADDDLKPQVQIFAKDALAYADDEAWIAVDWLASLFERLQKPNCTLRCPLIFWTVTDGLFAVIDSIAMHRKRMSYSQIRQIVFPMLIRCDKALSGLVTPGHSMDGATLAYDIVQSTFLVSGKFNRVRDALCDGVYGHSIYDAVKAFKALREKWDQPVCEHPDFFRDEVSDVKSD